MKSDSAIQSDVLQELKWDPSVTHEHIGVAVSRGIVTLSGTVPTFFEKSAAEKAAQRVSGVTAVVEQIEIKPVGSYKRDDQDIAEAILNQFKWHSQILEDNVHVKVEDGWVTLTGEFDWEYQRTAAEDAVRRLLGVKGITNRITIKVRVAQPVDIKEKIESALKRAVEREVDRLKVEVRGSEVILSGKVRSFAELRDVRGAAWSAPGVTAVNASNVSVAA